MTGIEIIRDPALTAEAIADIVSQTCPPDAPAECDRLGCRECWLSWLTTGEPPKGKEPPDGRTAPGEVNLDRVNKLLAELDGYVSGISRGRTSQ